MHSVIVFELAWLEFGLAAKVIEDGVTQLSPNTVLVGDGVTVVEGVVAVEGVVVVEGVTVGTGVSVGASVGVAAAGSADDSMVKFNTALRRLICSVARIVWSPACQFGLTLKVTLKVPFLLTVMLLFDVMIWLFGCTLVATPADVEA